MIMYVFGKCSIERTKRFHDTFHKDAFEEIEKTDRPDLAGSGQRSGRTTPRARASIYTAYIFIHNAYKRESKKGRKERRNTGRGKQRKVSARMMHTCMCARVRLPRLENARYSIPHTYN